MPVIDPLISDENLTPSSVALASLLAGLAGADEALQVLHGQPKPALVVNAHTLLAPSALPARSLTRGSVTPPTTVAVYVVEGASALLGVSVAVRDTAS